MRYELRQTLVKAMSEGDVVVLQMSTAAPPLKSCIVDEAFFPAGLFCHCSRPFISLFIAVGPFFLCARGANSQMWSLYVKRLEVIASL